MDLVVQQHPPQLSLLLLVQAVLVALAKLRVGIRIAETQSQIVLVNRDVLEDALPLEVLDGSSRAAHDDAAVDVLVTDVLEYFLDALDTGAPATDHAQEYVVGEVGAVLALAHVVVQLGQS